jgi:hypothetical protein
MKELLLRFTDYHHLNLIWTQHVHVSSSVNVENVLDHLEIDINFTFKICMFMCISNSIEECHLSLLWNYQLKVFTNRQQCSVIISWNITANHNNFIWITMNEFIFMLTQGFAIELNKAKWQRREYMNHIQEIKH